ncbi:hypothetical protein F5883DRAFT_575663 [Diaporthe sp. PMI_573]|nr:hypothetical protein F5883DRAFT_575663 [Diaporthaceae sp. PMI_573]
MSVLVRYLNLLRTDPERLLAWERSTFESLETYSSEDQAESSHHNVDHSVKTVQPPLSPDFLKLFHEMLPQELRDMVYAHILGPESGTWTIQPHGLYFRFDRRIADAPTRIIPPSLETSRHPIFSTVHRELVTYFFSKNTVVLRYRYDSTTLEILTRLCKHLGCRPNQYIKRLHILVCPPESPEDDMYCDEEAEFEWHHMFPRPKNARSLAQRRQLETDLREIGLQISKDCDTEFTFMVSEQEWKASLGPNGMDEWLCSIKDTGRVRLFWYDWEKVIA